MLNLTKASKKIFSGSVAILFALNTLLPAGFSASSDARSVSGEALLKNIPVGIAQVESVVHGTDTDKPFVIYIQDAHSNPEAQESIRKILHVAYDQVGPDKLAIALEGAAGEIHPEYFRVFKDYPQADEAMVKDLVAKGEVTGAELFARDLDLKGKFSTDLIRGVENADVYHANAEAYQSLTRSREDIRTLTGVFKQGFQSAESRWFSPELRDFIQEKSRRKNGDFGGSRVPGESNHVSAQFNVYIDFLTAKAREILKLDMDQPVEQIRFPNLYRLHTIAQLQKENSSEKARLEWKEIKASFSTEEQKQMEAFFDAANRHSEKDQRDFFITIALNHPEAFQKIEKSDALKRFLAIHVLYREILPDALMNEVEQIEKTIEGLLEGSVQSRELLDLEGSFGLLQKMLLLELTAQDWARVRSELYSLNPSALSAGLKKLETPIAVTDITRMEFLFQDALDFYESAVKRDSYLSAQALAFARERQAEFLVIISGGFHAQGFENVFQKEGVSYALLRPGMGSADGGRLYHHAMAGKNSIPEGLPAGMRFVSEQTGLFLNEVLENGLPVVARETGADERQLLDLLSEVLKTHPVLSTEITFEREGSALQLSMPAYEAPAALTAAVKQSIMSSPEAYVRLAPAYGQSTPDRSAWRLRTARTDRGTLFQLARSEVRTFDDQNIQGTLLGRTEGFSKFDTSEHPLLKELQRISERLSSLKYSSGQVDFVFFKNELAITPDVTLQRPDKSRHFIRVNLEDFLFYERLFSDPRMGPERQAKLTEIILQGLINGAFHLSVQASQGAPGLEARLFQKADAAAFRQLGLLAYTLQFSGVDDPFEGIAAFLDSAKPSFVSFFTGLEDLGNEELLEVASRVLDTLPDTNLFRTQLVTDLTTHVIYSRLNAVGYKFLEDTLVIEALSLLEKAYGDREKAYHVARDGIRASHYVQMGIYSRTTAASADDVIKQINTVLTRSDQIRQWRKGTQTQSGDSVYLPRKEETTVIKVPYATVLGLLSEAGAENIDAYGVVSVESGKAIRITEEGLKKIGHRLVSQIYSVVSAGGLGSRFGQRDYTKGPEPDFIDRAKGVYRLNLGAQRGDRSFYEIAVAEVAATNQQMRQEGVISKSTENIPLTFLASQFTFTDTVKDLERMGYGQYTHQDLENSAVQNLLGLDKSISQVSSNVTVFHHEDIDAPLVYLIHIHGTELIDKRTGEFYRHTDPNLRERDLVWPDNHDASLLDPILTGLTAHFEKQGRRIRFISNIDNRAGDIDLRLAAILYLSGQSLLNEGAEIRGEKGGLLTKFKSMMGLPAWLEKLSKTLSVPLFSRRIVEGFELTPISAEEDKAIMAKIKLFNSGSFLAHDRRLEVQMFDSAHFPKFISTILQEAGTLGWLIAEAAYRFLNLRFEAHKMVKSTDNKHGAIYPTFLAGSIPGSPASTVFVEVPRDVDSRFEPQKESMENLRDMEEFLQFLVGNLPLAYQTVVLKDLDLNKLIQDDLFGEAVDLSGQMADGTYVIARMKFILSDKVFTSLTAQEAKERVTKAIAHARQSIGRVAEKEMKFFTSAASTNTANNAAPSPSTAKSEVRAAAQNFKDTADLLREIAEGPAVASTLTAPARETAQLLSGIYPDVDSARSEVRQSLNLATQMTALSEADDALLGIDFINTFFAKAVLYKQNKQHVLHENVNQLPEFDRGMKLWARYLATHQDLTWALDVDGVDQNTLKLFKAKLIEMAEAWGTPIDAGQIVLSVSGNGRQGFEPSNLRLLPKNQLSGYLSSDETVLNPTLAVKGALFHRTHTSTAFDRMIAAEALRNQIPDDLQRIIGPLSELAAVIFKTTYKALEAGFAAYQRISASA